MTNVSVASVKKIARTFGRPEREALAAAGISDGEIAEVPVGIETFSDAELLDELGRRLQSGQRAIDLLAEVQGPEGEAIRARHGKFRIDIPDIDSDTASTA